MNYPEYTKIYQICFFCMLKDQDKADQLDSTLINKIILRSESEWESITDIIASNCQQNNEIPILHLDMHGDENGFSDGNNKHMITWDRIIPQITAINQACNNQLFLSLNICKGLKLFNNIGANNPPICLNAIGSIYDILATEGEQRFDVMYADYFNNPKGKDMNRAINEFFNCNVVNALNNFCLQYNF